MISTSIIEFLLAVQTHQLSSHHKNNDNEPILK